MMQEETYQALAGLRGHVYLSANWGVFLLEEGRHSRKPLLEHPTIAALLVDQQQWVHTTTRERRAGDGWPAERSRALSELGL